MGDQIGTAVGGTLYFIPYAEIARIRNISVSSEERAGLFADLCRINTLYMIAQAGSGHIGSSFSSMDIMSWLQLEEIRTTEDGHEALDIFFSSKGHDAPALYSTLIGLGKLDFNLIHQLRRLHGLPGHPDISTLNIVTNTGSLGMGISKAKGMIFAKRLQNKPGRVFVLTGDGELQEGQIWESLISAANDRLDELVVIVDHNKIQSDTLISRVSDLGDLEAKFAAFGWHVSRCDGNSISEIAATLAAVKASIGQPKVIIADTVKGKGVSFMEHTSIDSDVEFYKFHSGAPTADSYRLAVQELINAANEKLVRLGQQQLLLESVTRPIAVTQENPQRLVAAYTNALLEQARKHPSIVALDADLILDTGLIPFQKEFPERFVECGIAEQDMVSQAGGMALQGLLPIVHSFGCFLSARPGEQIYNNATEHTKIIYVGSLAGVVPGGPGHSHQAVRDISSLAAIPGLVVIEPSCEQEVSLLLDWAISRHAESSYLRLVSVPCQVEYSMPADYIPEPGKGVVLLDGTDAAVMAYGPVMLGEAMKAARELMAKYSLSLKVINMPWLNKLDPDWVQEAIAGLNTVVTMDNHYFEGGLGQRLRSVLWGRQEAMLKTMIHLGIDGVPVCGSIQDVLRFHHLDAAAIVDAVAGAIDEKSI
jgi:transketolase